mmetsp:Transcript_104425/g.239161  ORF Transcript_104425/g.239161 Transcript_104425/m.239161 type:complete len:564 (+) Transcript_104425:408-2099(+)
MSLSGHTSPVGCLVFDKDEEMIVAGSTGGSLKIWNLEQQRVSGTLSGHRTNCTAVEFHPYGEFFASGAGDTNLKIWDMRRKQCIQTYKGHNGAVSCIRFSPHGRWVASGSQDNRVILWDLTAGKKLHEFQAHQAAITTMDFHMTEYFFASGSADRTVKLWSVDTFSLVGSSDFDQTTVSALKFHPEERTVVSASQQSLKVYSWEPQVECGDWIDVPWTGMCDIVINAAEKRAVGLSHQQQTCAVWVADLEAREPRGANANGSRPRVERARTGSSSDRVRPARVPTDLSDVPTSDAADHAPMVTGVAAAPARYSSDVDAGLSGRNGYGSGRDAARGASHFPETEEHVTVRKRPDTAPGNDVPKPRPAPVEPRAAAVVPEPRPVELSTRLLERHEQMLAVLTHRVANARAVTALWEKGEFVTVVAELQRLNDTATTCDFLRMLIKSRQKGMNLDACNLLLPMLDDVLGSKYENFVSVALDCVQHLLNTFGDIISDTRAACSGVPGHQLDLAKEDRLRKCNGCYTGFEKVHSLLDTGTLGRSFSTQLATKADDMSAALKGFLSASA